MTDFASVKLRRPFLTWLKVEAARRGVPMYDLVEELVARGGRRAWGGSKGISRKKGAP